MLAVGSGGTLIDQIPGFTDFSQETAHSLGPGFIQGVYSHGIIHVVLAALVFVIVLAMAAKAGGAFKPRLDQRLTVRTFMELIFDGIMNLMSGMMGEKNARRFFPLIGTLALFILISNALALVPGMAPPTDNLNTTVAPAIVVFFVTHYAGIKASGAKYAAHFLGPILKWYALPLMLLMLLIESIGHLARVLSLSLRLMGNMFADHTVLAVFMGMFPFLVPLPSMMLGCVVVVVQTFVFCLLSVIYISLALEEHDEDH